MNETIAVIILNYNDYNDTIKCADNIIEKCSDVIVVIVDNASTNETFSILKEKYMDVDNCHVLKNEKNNGYSAGNNFGMRYIEKEFPDVKYYTIMNPDTLFDDSEIFHKLAHHLDENSNIAVIGPVMWMYGENCFNQSTWKIPNALEYFCRQIILYNKFNPRKTCSDNNVSDVYITEVVHGSFFMIRANIIRELGYLDENLFMYDEENLLALKIREKGYVEAIAMDAKYDHNHPKAKDIKPFVQDVKGLYRGGFHSRKYIWKCYYPRIFLPFLYFAFCFNVLTYAAFHIRRLFKKK